MPPAPPPLALRRRRVDHAAQLGAQAFDLV
jgi:hypothetical protein